MKHLHETLVDFAHEAHKQEDKGIVKYGKPLDPLDDYDWLEMCKQEQVDGYKYLHAEQVKRDYLIGEIREVMRNNLMPLSTVGKIDRLLDRLQGK